VFYIGKSADIGFPYTYEAEYHTVL